MSISSRVIQSYGDDMLVGAVHIKGLLSPINKNDHKAGVKLAAGVVTERKYRLITDDKSIKMRQTVTYEGFVYDVLWVEQVKIFGSFSHNECVLRLKGACEDA